MKKRLATALTVGCVLIGSVAGSAAASDRFDPPYRKGAISVAMGKCVHPSKGCGPRHRFR